MTQQVLGPCAAGCANPAAGGQSLLRVPCLVRRRRRDGLEHDTFVAQVRLQSNAVLAVATCMGLALEMRRAGDSVSETQLAMHCLHALETAGRHGDKLL